jgi:hypothetical protein
MNHLAEAVWTLALSRSPEASKWWKDIDPNVLDRHGFVAYISAASLLGKYTTDLHAEMMKRLDTDKSATWYWNARTDRSIYAQLLYKRGDREK